MPPLPTIFPIVSLALMARRTAPVVAPLVGEGTNLFGVPRLHEAATNSLFILEVEPLLLLLRLPTGGAGAALPSFLALFSAAVVSNGGRRAPLGGGSFNSVDDLAWQGEGFGNSPLKERSLPRFVLLLAGEQVPSPAVS